jgi:hypothetical protein
LEDNDEFSLEEELELGLALGADSEAVLELVPAVDEPEFADGDEAGAEE